MIPEDQHASRIQTLGEEIANSVSHGIGLLAAVAVIPFLVVTAVRYGDAGTIVAASIFGASMVLLYGSSTLYHALPWKLSKAKRLFQLFDHISIYILIAGSYTPFTLGVLRGSLGWTLFGIIWGLAIFGVLLKCLGKMWHPLISTGLYLLMGWLIIIAIVPLVQGLTLAGLTLFIIGGLAYSGGVIFYVLDHKPYAHFIWHLFVLAGTGCHVAAILSMQGPVS
jgi:hemolysin III